ncbi:MAG: hypothetical protein EZS28_009290 [Streblomastix strix]|uniref:Uncharacterized protein n=1 Tax=Streblomastix strix TaxID=222440 RepID=A0A5J4WKW3_9EUKA|nr:MAG: hypothetical protein EZS28_009290 [Streblomastix strix]
MKNKNNWDSFVLTGCNADPTDRDGVWKMGSTSSQFRIVSPLPIEYATQQTLGIGVFDFFTWGKATLLNNRTTNGYTLFSVMYDSAKPKFSGSSYNIPLNAIIYLTKQIISRKMCLPSQLLLNQCN